MSNYYKRSRSYSRPEVPTGPVHMNLVQTHKGVTVPEGTILNSPAPSEDTWMVEMGRKVPSEFWRQLGIKATFWSRDMLEDFDMFHAEPGWRVFGSQAELAVKLAKHHVSFENFEDQQKARAEAKRKKEEKAAEEARQKAIRDAEYAKVAEQAAALLPRGIRPLTTQEHDAAWAQINQARGNDWKVQPAELVLKLEVEGDYRLPAMAGNEGGNLGWKAIYRVQFASAPRLVVWHVTTGYDMGGPSIQGVEITDGDAALLADYASRRAIVAYRYDARLWDLLAALDAEGKVSKYGRGAWFGGTPRASSHGEYTRGAYSYQNNSTAAEMRATLIEYLSAQDDVRAKEAVAILSREDSITELR
jgi:hypothetical protein